MEARGLKHDQLRWRRAKMRDLRDRFPQEYPEDDVTCFLASGRCVFEMQALMAAQQRIVSEARADELSSLIDHEGNALPLPPARLLIWKHPEPGREYVIGADVGEGLAHGDASAACVIDKESGEQAAELHGQISPERFARLLDALGRHFNRAELAVERNNHGHSVLNTLFHGTSYPDLYHHTDYDQAGRNRRELGWPTDQKTKPIMIDDLVEAIGGGHFLIHSSGLVDECFTFVVTDTGSQEAQPRKHDDRVIAAAIAWQVRKRPVPQVAFRRSRQRREMPTPRVPGDGNARLWRQKMLCRLPSGLGRTGVCGVISRIRAPRSARGRWRRGRLTHSRSAGSAALPIRELFLCSYIGTAYSHRLRRTRGEGDSRRRNRVARQGRQQVHA